MNLRKLSPAVILLVASLICLLLVTTDASAAINNDGIMDQVLSRFESNASNWAGIIESAATRLFWTLVLISMVITFGFMALRKADIGEFFAEFTRFTIFTGFFWWLLINGPAFARSIINSLRQLGGSAAGLGGYSELFSPSEIVDIGFIMLGKTLVESSVWSPVDSAVGIALGFAVLLMTAMIAVNVLMLYVTAWMMSYGGIFYLGFGGSRWTSEIAINYFKATLGIAIQIMTMILIIGIGVSVINDYYTNMQTQLDLTEMAVITVIIFTIMLLSNKVPQLLSGIITGHATSGMGIGQFGIGAAVGTADVAAAATVMAGAMVSSGVSQGAKGASALLAAVSQANADIASGDGFSVHGLSGDAGGGSDKPSGTGDTPFAKAAGFAGSPLAKAFDSSSSSRQEKDNSGDNSVEDSGSGSTDDNGGSSDSGDGDNTDGISKGRKGVLGTMGSGAEILAKGTSDIAKIDSEMKSADETEVDMAAEIAAFVGTDTKQS